MVILRSNSSFFAPTTLSTIFPSFSNIRVGIASTFHPSATDCGQTRFSMFHSKKLSQRDKVCIYRILGPRIIVTSNSSTSTLRNMTLGIFLANSAIIGLIKRHGPHQEAVKSTTTYIYIYISQLMYVRTYVRQLS